MRDLIAGKRLHHVQGNIDEVLSKGALAYGIQQNIDEGKVLSIDDSYTLPNISLLLFGAKGESPDEKREIKEIQEMVAYLSKEQGRKQLEAGRSLGISIPGIQLRTSGRVNIILGSMDEAEMKSLLI